MRVDLWEWEHLLATDPGWGWTAIGLTSLALFAAGFAAVGAPRARSGAVRVCMLGAAMTFTVAALCFVGFSVHEGRVSILDHLIHPRAPYWTAGAVFELEMIAEATLAPLLLLALPGTLLASTRCVRSREGRALGRVALLISVTLGLAASVAIVALRWGALEYTGFHVRRTDLLVSHFSSISLGLDVAIGVIGLMALAAFSVFAWRRRRAASPTPRGRWSWVAAGLVFAFGATAFVWTRAHAHDRHHPVSLQSDRLYLRAPVPELPDWVSESVCHDLGIAPVVVFHGERVTIDGRTVDRQGLTQDLDTLSRNWKVLHPREPFPGQLNVVAPPDMSMVELERWLRPSRLLYSEIVFVMVRSRYIEVATLGRVPLPRACAFPMSFSRPSYSRPVPCSLAPAHCAAPATVGELWRVASRRKDRSFTEWCYGSSALSPRALPSSP